MALAKKKVYSFSCPPELYARATALCKTRGCTKSWLVAKGLERILAEEEEDARDYEAAAADVPYYPVNLNNFSHNLKGYQGLEK